MIKNPVLLKYLKGLSPLFRKLVERALKEGISFITFKAYSEQLKKRTETIHIKTPDVWIFGFGNFPEIGLEKIVVASMFWLSEKIKEGSLGAAELTLAHEIGHELSWSEKPFCAHVPSPKLLSFKCAYFEALATKIGFDILKELNPERNLKLLYKGELTGPLEIYHRFGVPSGYISDCLNCPALNVYNLDNCPKEKETRELVKIIEKSNF